MIYNHELILVDNLITKDSIGQGIKTEILTTVFCGVKSIMRNEHYAAATVGLKPSIIFVIHHYEYNGQLKAKFEGKEYKVIRTYATSIEEIELVCERVGSNG